MIFFRLIISTYEPTPTSRGIPFCFLCLLFRFCRRYPLSLEYEECVAGKHTIRLCTISAPTAPFFIRVFFPSVSVVFSRASCNLGFLGFVLDSVAGESDAIHAERWQERIHNISPKNTGIPYQGTLPNDVLQRASWNNLQLPVFRSLRPDAIQAAISLTGSCYSFCVLLENNRHGFYALLPWRR